VLVRLRLWLPDAPGALGAVAAAIGDAKGNVVGLEVLERDAGVAIDELVVELPDDDDAVEAVCRGVRLVQGAGVEDVTELGGQVPDREDTVLDAATAILRAISPGGVRHELAATLMALFGLTWFAVADEALQEFLEVQGDDAPTVQWMAAFSEGARSGADPVNDTIGSGVFVEPVPYARITVCGGRPAAIRRRERNEIAMLVMVAARFMEALDGGAAPSS
jgi:hypothetical protein